MLPAEGLARFGIDAEQQLPRNAFVPLATLQDLLEQPGKANAILVATNEADAASATMRQQALNKALRPTLEDYGVHDRSSSTSPTNVFQIVGRPAGAAR